MKRMNIKLIGLSLRLSTRNLGAMIRAIMLFMAVALMGTFIILPLMTFHHRIVSAQAITPTITPIITIEPAIEPLRRVRVPILMYHYISVPPADADKYRLDLSVTPQNFYEQMAWLKQNGYHTITPDDLMAAVLQGKKLPSRPVLLTFDDGYTDAYTEAFPILREFGLKGTFFIVTSWLDEGKSGYITWEQAREMMLWGMAMQSHSKTHSDMRKRDRDWLVYEILGSIQSIEAHVGVRPYFFCYPGGQFDQNVIEELKAAGMVAAFTTNDGTYTMGDNLLVIPRVRIRGSTSLATFANLLTWER